MMFHHKRKSIPRAQVVKDVLQFLGDRLVRLAVTPLVGLVERAKRHERGAVNAQSGFDFEAVGSASEI
jgi:hypothetical protein